MRGPGAANVATSPARGRASPGARRRRWASNASRSMPACGRRRCTSRAPRRRSSTCSQARASPCSGRARATRSATRCAPGDCLVHLALDSAHTLQAGPDGLDVLAFGQRTFANGITWLPRAGVAWLGETWAPVGAEEDHPWTREAAAGPPEVTELSPRPSSIVQHRRSRRVRARSVRRSRRRARDLGRAAGSARTGSGLRRRGLPRQAQTPPHCHSAEEEIFVVLEGDGRRRLAASTVASSRARCVARPTARPSLRHRRRASGGNRSSRIAFQRRASDGMTRARLRNPRSQRDHAITRGRQGDASIGARPRSRSPRAAGLLGRRGLTVRGA